MAYQIDRFDRTLLTVVQDGTVDETTNLRFIGKNFAGYGEIHNENFLFLLENFAGANPPSKPISGQVWFDSAQSKLKFYDGTKWRTTGGSEVTDNAPNGLTEGDFWWDNFSDQLYVFNGNSFVLIGPQSAGGAGVTQLVSQSILNSDNGEESVIIGFVDDTAVFIISPTQFTILDQPGNRIDGFNVVRQGITLKDSQNGVTTSNYRFFGSASNAEKLDGRLASDYVTYDNPAFVNRVFADSGVNAGDALIIEPSSSSPDGIIRNDVASGKIQFRVNDGSSSITTINVTSQGIEPAEDLTYDLGTATKRFKSIYAEGFEGGPAQQADKLKLDDGNGGVIYVSASIDSLAKSIVVRDADRKVYASEFVGIASSAKYADLAEKYTADADYPVGTIMTVGGKAETTAASAGDVVIGVVSTAPAYVMNSDCEGPAIGLKGRVPVRVVGPVRKGQAIYAGDPGVGTTAISSSLVGVALEDSDSTSESLVECVLKV